MGDIAWSGVLAKFGWSRCHNNDAAFERCTFPAACLGGTNPALMGKYLDKNNLDLAECQSNCSARCNKAYVNESILCGQCAYNYSHDGLTGRCDRFTFWQKEVEQKRQQKQRVKLACNTGQIL